MSVKVMNYVWDIPTLKGSDKLVMLCLADHADERGICWPSIDTIARKSGVSVTTVKSTLKKLVAAGWIAKKNQFKKADSGRFVRSNNQYQLSVMRLRKQVDALVDVLIDAEQTNVVSSNHEPIKTPLEGRQIPTGGRAKSGYKPSKDPSKDPTDLSIARAPEKMITQKLDFSLFGEMTDQQAQDIIRIRKTNAKQIPVTQTVLNMLAKEFQKAGQQFGLSLQDCLDEWEYRGWRGFKAEWIGNSMPRQTIRAELPDFHSGDTSWADGLVLGGDQ